MHAHRFFHRFSLPAPARPAAVGRPVILLPIVALALLFALTAPALAQMEQSTIDAGPAIQWQRGPSTMAIGDDLAEIDLPEAFVYLDREDTQALMEYFGNPVNGTEQATLAPASDDEQWIVVFEWDGIGYVETEDQSLDADALLESIRAGTEQANEVRRERGWSTMEIVGWREVPHYDAATQNLTWAIEGRSDGAPNVNRVTKLLGRKGVMNVTVVSSLDELPRAVEATDQLLTQYRFVDGQRYADFVPGTDRVAELGLAALVAGGAGAALVKSGLLGRIWKLLVLGAIAALSLGRRLMRTVFGGRADETVAVSADQIGATGSGGSSGA